MATTDIDFDLLIDPWFDVRTTVGTIEQRSILGMLDDAAGLVEIADPSPLVVFGLHRLLAAVLLQALELEDEEAWVALWEQRRFAPEALARVGELCAGRFRLFDPERPFYQAGDIPLAPVPKDAKTVGYLLPELSTGTNIAHFDHRGDEDHALCGVCCAKGLVLLAAFATAGGAGIKAGLTGVPPTYLLPLGDNLFETLLLNLLLPDYWKQSAADPGPRWAREPAVPKSVEQLRVGRLEALTWTPRRVRLFPDGPGTCSACGAAGTVVRRMVYQQGCSLAKEIPYLDPWAAYKPRDDAAADLIPHRPRPDRDLWRDFPELVLHGDLRPQILHQADDLTAELPELERPDRCRIAAVAVRTDMKAKLFEWHHDRFEFPPALVADPQAETLVRDSLALAETLAGVLRAAIRKLHPVASRPQADRQAVRTALEAAVRIAVGSYWQGLASAFHGLLNDPALLAGDVGRGAVQHHWHAALRHAATAAFEAARRGMADDARSYVREATASSYLYGWMKKHLRKEE